MERIKIREEQDGFYVILSNPEKKNAIDKKMITELNQFFSEDKRFRDKKFLVLEGEGDVFCAGGDLEWMAEKGKAGYFENYIDALELGLMYRYIWSCPVPVIAKLHGGAWGGGVGFIAVSDIVIAQKDAKIRLPEVKIGLVPAIVSVFLIRKIGLSRYLELALLGKEITAEEGEKIGLVNFSVPPENLDETKDRVIELICQGTSRALSSIKRLSRLTLELDLDLGLKLAAEYLSNARADEEAQKRIEEFFRRKKRR